MSLANGDIGFELGKATVTLAPDLGKGWYRVNCHACTRTFIAKFGTSRCPMCQKDIMVEVKEELKK